MCLRFLQMVDAREFKKIVSRCYEILILVERFFHHVANTYAK